jgi:CheY-like chemotaxis protein
MGGTISVESVPGEGSTFRVRMPAASDDDRSGAGAAMPPAAGVLGYRCREGRKPLRVLVVDDELENRQVLRGLLEALGFAVQEAEGGSAAITAAEAAPPDLVLMDLRMPEMDGIAATRALRERPAFRHLPIVAVTAAAFAEDRERALTVGFDAHLAKPVLFDALIETLGTLLPIEWERGEERDESAPAEPERLPRSYAERLESLVRTGSVTAVRALAADWAQEGCCPFLAQRLAALADEFDLVGLRRLAEEVDMAAGAEGTGQTSEGNPSGVAKALRGD